jgi:hypothetical protein
VEALWQWKGKEDPPPPPTPQGTPVKCGGYIWRPDSDGILRSGQGEAISDATGVRSVLSRGEAIMDAEGAIIPLHGRVYVIALPPAGKPERAFGYWLLTPVAVVGDIILSPVYLAVGVIYLADVFNR